MVSLLPYPFLHWPTHTTRATAPGRTCVICFGASVLIDAGVCWVPEHVNDGRERGSPPDTSLAKQLHTMTPEVAPDGPPRLKFLELVEDQLVGVTDLRIRRFGPCPRWPLDVSIRSTRRGDPRLCLPPPLP